MSPSRQFDLFRKLQIPAAPFDALPPIMPATIRELPPTQIFDVQTLGEKIASLAIYVVPHDPAKLRQRMLMEVCAAASSRMEPLRAGEQSNRRSFASATPREKIVIDDFVVWSALCFFYLMKQPHSILADDIRSFVQVPRRGRPAAMT
jgi:hypothetical protein